MQEMLKHVANELNMLEMRNCFHDGVIRSEIEYIYNKISNDYGESNNITVD